MKVKPIKDDRYKCLMVIPMIKYNTFLRIKKVFPARRSESAADYFERLAKFLEDTDLR